jgi:SH3 domain protein
MHIDSDYAPVQNRFRRTTACKKEPILRLLVFMFLFSTFFPLTSLATDTRYAGGEQSLTLRGGPGGDFAIVYRGIPPGTRFSVARTSEDGLWADVTTDTGITGWVPTQNLVLEEPAPIKPPATVHIIQGTDDPSGAAAAVVAAPSTDPVELLNRINSCDAEFNTVAQELHQLKQVAGNAVQLDIDNHRLVEEAENLRSDVEMLRAENLRLQDNLESEDFMNGALAVLLGVIIALIAPRLVPQRRKNSGWA